MPVYSIKELWDEANRKLIAQGKDPLRYEDVINGSGVALSTLQNVLAGKHTNTRTLAQLAAYFGRETREMFSERDKSAEQEKDLQRARRRGKENP